MRGLRHSLALLCVFVLMLLSPSFAAADEAALEAEGVRVWTLLPRPSEMIRHPSPKSWEVYGGKKAKIKLSTGVPGGKAASIKIKSAAKNPWGIGANVAAQLPVKSGDVILGTFWARASTIGSRATSTPLPFSLQQTSAPYTQLANETAILGPNWQQYFVYAAMPKSYKKGQMGLAVQLAAAAHTVELGPVYLMNMGPGAVDAASMPTHKTPAPPPPAQSNTTQSDPAKAKPVVPTALQNDYAQVISQLPFAGELLAAPDIATASVFGDQKSERRVSDTGVPGGQALEVTVKQAGLNSWSTGINWATTGQISKGDVVFLAYWAKGISAQNEAQTPVISPVNVQQSSEPYNTAISGAAFLSRDWKLYYASGQSDHDIAPGNAGISFHIGLSPQTLRLGPSYLINLGPNADVNALPRNRISYGGQSETAPWRAQALAKIEQHRKGDITITVTDKDGTPLAGQAVSVQMTQHAFHFGTFVGHQFIKDDGSKDARYHDSFAKNFNMATLPLYWQDWGWNGPWRRAYENTVKYAAKTGLAWRGHPIIWPGESYMPSYIKDAKGNPKKQRKMVLNHVKEVMTFVAPYKPIAVDMVNEVRVNQYFKEQGDTTLVADAFRIAHDIAPDVPLFVNDYAILNNGGFNQKAIDFYHDWIRDMRAQNVPLGGIGFQAHFGAGLTDPARIMDILADFAQYDLPLHITEFDIETYDEDTQADYTRDMLIAAFSEPALEAFVVWGWWEGDHWKKPAAMLREDWSEKPNYKAWRKTVFDDFWTRETVVTDANGVVRLRGFKGDYTLTVGGKKKTFKLDDAATLTLVAN